jgi:hypothetical protein
VVEIPPGPTTRLFPLIPKSAVSPIPVSAQPEAGLLLPWISPKLDKTVPGAAAQATVGNGLL